MPPDPPDNMATKLFWATLPALEGLLAGRSLDETMASLSPEQWADIYHAKMTMQNPEVRKFFGGHPAFTGLLDDIIARASPTIV